MRLITFLAFIAVVVVIDAMWYVSMVMRDEELSGLDGFICGLTEWWYEHVMRVFRPGDWWW